MGPDDALGIDHETGRDTADLEPGSFQVVHQRDGEVVVVHLDESLDRSLGLVAGTDDVQIRIVLEFLIQRLDVRHLPLAGTAPGGPEIDEDRLAAQIFQLQSGTVKKLEGDVRCGLPHHGIRIHDPLQGIDHPRAPRGGEGEDIVVDSGVQLVALDGGGQHALHHHTPFRDFRRQPGLEDEAHRGIEPETADTRLGGKFEDLAVHLPAPHAEGLLGDLAPRCAILDEEEILQTDVEIIEIFFAQFAAFGGLQIPGQGDGRPHVAALGAGGHEPACAGAGAQLLAHHIAFDGDLQPVGHAGLGHLGNLQHHTAGLTLDVVLQDQRAGDGIGLEGPSQFTALGLGLGVVIRGVCQGKATGGDDDQNDKRTDGPGDGIPHGSVLSNRNSKLGV